MDQPTSDTLGATAEPLDSAEQGVITGPRLVLVLEASRPLASSMYISLTDVREVRVGRGARRAIERTDDGVVVRVPDPRMSSRHASIAYRDGSWSVIDASSRNGSSLNGVRVTRADLRHDDVMAFGHTLFLFQQNVARRVDQPLDRDAATETPHAFGLITFHPTLADELERAARLANAPVSIVILGDSGTGKEVLARALHALSGRSGEFVAVNCGALPETLIESELFGHKKGAFSGAVSDRPGLVRGADRGTLFLDEIADLPASSQAALLRVLQEREVRPVGGTRPVPVDIRLVSATHKDLPGLVERGVFRRDLFARVSGFRLRLPGLRDRREDLGILIAALLPRVPGDAAGVTFSVEAAHALLRYPWPLNIRELENCLIAATALAGDQPIRDKHLPAEIRSPRGADRAATEPARRPVDAVDAAPMRELTAEQAQQRDALIALFREHKGNISAVARALDKHRRQIQRWVKRYGLNPGDYQ